MAISGFAKNYYEKMHPGYVSELLETDPEFIELFDNFAFDEVVNSGDLDDQTRMLAILAALVGAQPCSGQYANWHPGQEKRVKTKYF